MDLWIIDPDTGTPSTVVDTFVSLKWGRRLWGSGSVEIAMETHDLADLGIEIGAFLWVQDLHDHDHGGHLYLVEQVNVDPAQESPPVEITGRDLGVFLNFRSVIPPVGDSHDRITADVETAMKWYVTNHLVDPDNPDRAMARFTVAPSEGFGDTIDAAGRFQWVGDFIDGLGQPVGIGWEIAWDVDANEYVFDVVRGEDRTSTVFVDPEFETAESVKWLRSLAASPNFAYVAGQGEGDARVVVERYVGASEPTGYDRREVVLDARDLSDVSELEARGDAQLAETAETEGFQVVVAQNGSFTYPDDFDLGDVITIRSREFGLSAAAQVIGVIQETGSGEDDSVTTTIEVGHVWPTLPRRVRQTVDQYPSASGRT